MCSCSALVVVDAPLPRSAGARGPPELAAPLANLISTAKTALTSAEELTTPPLNTLLTVVQYTGAGS